MENKKVYLVFGRSGTGKTKYCYDKIFEHSYANDVLDFKNSAVYVVPEQYTFQSDKALIETGKHKGIMNVEVLSFMRLAYKISKEVGGVARKKITPIGKQLILFEVLRKNKKNLVSYGKSAGKSGFISMLENQLGEFKRYLVDDEKFNHIYNVLDESNNTLLKNKLNDLQILYDSYESVLEAKTLCENNELDLLIKNIPDSKFIRETHFYFDSFDGYTEQEVEIIGLLMRYSASCTITFCCDMDKKAEHVFGSKMKLIKRFVELCIANTDCHPCFVNLNEKEHNQDTPIRFKQNHSIAYVEKFLGGYSKKVFEDDLNDSIRIFRGNNPYEEVENAAQTIIELCKNRGYRFNEVAVVTPSLERYRNHARVVFDEYNIPIYLDFRNPILENKLAVFFVYAVRCLTENWRSEDVFTYLRCGYTDLSDQEIETLSTYVKTHGISGNKWVKGDWKYPPVGDCSLEEINHFRVNVVEKLMQLKESCDKEKTGKGIAKAFYDFLVSMKIPDKIEKYSALCIENDMSEKSLEIEQVWALIVELLEQIYLVIGDSTLYYNSLSIMINSAFENVSSGVVPFKNDCVIFGTTERSRTVDNLKALIVLGADDKSFPTALGSNSLFTDSERMFLSDNGMKLAPCAFDMSVDEPFKIYSTLTSASEFLMMSYCVMGESREKLRKASTITKLLNVFSDLKEESRKIYLTEADGERWTAKPAYRNLMYRLSDENGCDLLDDLNVYLFKYFSSNDKYKVRLKEDMLKITCDYQEEILSADIISKLYGEELRGSSSMLESFSSCPFKFFIDYGLRIRNYSYKIYDSANSGTLLHLVMEKYFKRIVDDNLWECETFDNSASAKLVDEIFDSVSTDDVMIYDDKDFVSKYYVDSMHNRAKYVVWAGYTALAASEFKPFAFEFAFNDRKDSELNAFRMKDGDISVVINGVIDRVDIFIQDNKAYVRVVDYKSSNKSFDYVNACHGIDMQLLIYMNVLLSDKGKELIKKRFGVDEVHPAGMFYQTMAVKDVEVDNSEYDEESVEIKRLNNYKLDGLVLKDEEIVKALDNTLKDSGVSVSLPVGFKVSGDFKASKHLWSQGEIHNLLDENKSVISNIIREVGCGVCSPKPYRNGVKDGCKYCDYALLCGWDNVSKKYPNFESLDRDNWMRKMEEKYHNKEKYDVEIKQKEGDE